MLFVPAKKYWILQTVILLAAVVQHEKPSDQHVKFFVKLIRIEKEVRKVVVVINIKSASKTNICPFENNSHKVLYNFFSLVFSLVLIIFSLVLFV